MGRKVKKRSHPKMKQKCKKQQQREACIAMRRKKKEIAAAINQNTDGSNVRSTQKTSTEQDEPHLLTMEPVVTSDTKSENMFTDQAITYETLEPEDIETTRQENDEYVENIALVIENEQESAYQPITGRRIIDINYLMSQIQEKACHSNLFDCKAAYFKLVGEKRFGLFSRFKFECDVCREVIFIDSENRSTEKKVDVNVAATTGIVAAGIGLSQFEEILSAMDIPVFTGRYYARLQDIVYENWENTALESMKAAAKREKDAAIAAGRLKQGIPLVDVCVDGAWGLRSYGSNYRSMSGTAAIIGKQFGEVLYLGVKNKYCMICAQATKQNDAPKEHVCYKNYDGPSSAMEGDIIADGFKSSLEMYGIIYARMIGDGDSSTYTKVLESKPYDHVNHTVEKIECRNHILRNFCNKLRSIVKDTKYVAQHRKTFSNEKIMSMRKVIIRSIKFHKINNDKNVSINLLHNDIINTVAHAYGNHTLCREYNCSKTGIHNINTFKEIQNSMFLFRVNAIVASVANKARSLIEDVDTNTCERLNSVIAKFVGGKRINFSQRRGYQGRCSAAVVSFNSHCAISAVQRNILGRTPTGKVRVIEQRRALKRKWNREHPTKKVRKLVATQQHSYGPTSAAPDMSPAKLERAKSDFLNNLKTMTNDRSNIERSTVLQRDSSEWIEIRKSLITASNFGSICKRQQTRSSGPAVKNIIYKKNLSHIASVAHGVENEKHALQKMERQLNIKILPCGLFIDKTYPFIGATPDGLVGDDKIVEVKCPITANKMGIDAAIKANKIDIYRYDKKKDTIKINTKGNWYYQIQGQLRVSEKKECIFGLWSGENEPLRVEYISRDDDFWEVNMENKIVEFYMKCLLPEIIDPRKTRGMPIRDIILEQAKPKQADQNPVEQIQIVCQPRHLNFNEF